MLSPLDSRTVLPFAYFFLWPHDMHSCQNSILFAKGKGWQLSDLDEMWFKPFELKVILNPTFLG